MPVVHCNRNCAERDALKAKVLQLEGAVSILKKSNKESGVLVVQGVRREEALKLTINRMRLWKR